MTMFAGYRKRGTRRTGSPPAPRNPPMSRRRRIYEGKAKVLYEGPEPGTLVQYFKDKNVVLSTICEQIKFEERVIKLFDTFLFLGIHDTLVF